MGVGTEATWRSRLSWSTSPNGSPASSPTTGSTSPVEAGEIHAIVGENGAGKSTLMKILYGMQPPDEGRMLVNGEEVHFTSPSDAIDMGIGMVHQHFMLADNLTVLENVILGSEPTTSFDRIDFDEARAHLARGRPGVRARRRPRRAGRDARGRRAPADRDHQGALPRRQDPDPRRADRGARARRRSRRCSTTCASSRPTARRSCSSTTSCSRCSRSPTRITVLRQGQTVATVKPADVTPADLAELMVGSELPTPDTTESTVTDRRRAVGVGSDDLRRAAGRSSRTPRSPCTAARSSGSPASRATARPS